MSASSFSDAANFVVAAAKPAVLTVGEPVRIAMWSGPRNISTAMMRSFGNRADTVEKGLGRRSLGIANVQVVNVPIVKHSVSYVWVNTSFAEMAIDIVPTLEFGQYCGHSLLLRLGTCA